MPNVSATLRGGAGNDTVTGGLKDDQLFGDTENDRLDGRAGKDLLDGGGGFDTVDYGYRAVQIKVTLANSATANDGSNSGDNGVPGRYNDSGQDNLKDVEAVIGGTAADSLAGSLVAEWFDGGGGNDSIYGGGGNDTITGGVNNDLAYGEANDDFFFMQDATADQFLGGLGVTSAAFDAGLDTPAPPISVSPSSAPSLTRRFPSASGLRGFGPTNFAPESDAPPLQPDTTFGPDENGKVITVIDGVQARITDVAIQPVEVSPEQVEEKIVVVGSAIGPSESYDFIVIRYNADGTLDDSFGPDNNGIVYTDFGGEGFTNDAAASLAIDDSGRIVVAGTASQPQTVSGPEATVSNFAVARYLPDGSLDPTFGSGGLVLVDPDGVASDDHAARIAIQKFQTDSGPVDYYVIAGALGPTGVIVGDRSVDTYDFGVIRLTSSGAVDTGFGLIRKEFGPPDQNDDAATGLAIDPLTNNIWVSGYTIGPETNADFALAGYFPGGTPIDGASTTLDFLEDSDDQAFAAVIDGSQIYVVGQSLVGETAVGALASFNIAVQTEAAPGELVNATFVTDPSERSVRFFGVGVDDQGHGVAVGTLGSDDFYVYRFDPDLMPAGDPAVVDFGTETSFSSDRAIAVALQGDGKLVVAGLANDDAALVRLQFESFVDVVLSPQDVQAFNFTFVDENNTPQPIPNFLVRRVTALKPDGTLEIFGEDFDDVIKVTQSPDGIITVDVNTELFQVNASQVTRVIIHGLKGNDIISTDGSLHVPVILFGDEGDDLLRGSNNTSSGRLPVPSEQLFGGPDNDILQGKAGNDLLSGDGGNDVCVGDDGDDQVMGGPGNDILIGGRGRDKVRGGDNDDLVTGGYSIYDDDVPALKLLIAEWGNPAHSFTQRFANLQGQGTGGGLNGNTYLKPGQTVFDDGVTDELSGEAGQDWFIADRRGPDILFDLLKGERLTRL